MPNFLDNLDVIDANNNPTNVLFQDRGAMALINNMLPKVNAMTEVFLDVESPPSGLTAMVPDGKSNNPTDNTSAFQAIIDYAGDHGKIIVLHGIYGCSDTVTINKNNVHIIGTGGDYSNRDNQPMLTLAGSVILRIGNNATPIIEIGTNNVQAKGVVLEDFGVNGNNIANRGIVCNRMLNSAFTRLSITDVTDYGLFLEPRHTAIDSEVNLMFNTFTDVFINRVHSGLYMGGWYESGSGANCCYNLFIRLRIDCYYMGGYLLDADNNVFVATSCYPRGDDHYDFAFIFGPNFRSNVFYSLGATILAQEDSSNVVFEYDRENMEPSPTLVGNAVLTYTNCSRNGDGIHLGTNKGLYLNGRRYSNDERPEVNKVWGDVKFNEKPLADGYIGKVYCEDGQWHNFGAIVS